MKPFAWTLTEREIISGRNVRLELHTFEVLRFRSCNGCENSVHFKVISTHQVKSYLPLLFQYPRPLVKVSGPTTQKLQDDPIYGNQTTSTLLQARLQRNSTRRVNPKQNVEPSEHVNLEPDDPKAPSTRAKPGQESHVSETRYDVGRRREQPAVYLGMDEFETTQGRPVATGRQRKNRNFQAIVRDEDDLKSDEPQEPFPTRPPAPYEVRGGHPNFTDTFPPAAAPDPSEASWRQSQKGLYGARSAARSKIPY